MINVWLKLSDKRELLQHYLDYGYEDTLKALPHIIGTTCNDLLNLAEIYIEGMNEIDHKRRMEND